MLCYPIYSRRQAVNQHRSFRVRVVRPPPADVDSAASPRRQLRWRHKQSYWMIATQLSVVRLPLSRVALGNIHPVRAIFGHHNSRPLKCLFFSSDFLFNAFDRNVGCVQTHPFGTASDCTGVGRILVHCFGFVEISHIMNLLLRLHGLGGNRRTRTQRRRTILKQSF